MTIYIGHHAFSGPCSSPEQVEERSGLYALAKRLEKGWKVLELGQATNLQTAVAACLSKATDPEVAVAVLYTPGVQRAARERLLESVRAAMGPSGLASGGSGRPVG